MTCLTGAERQKTRRQSCIYRKFDIEIAYTKAGIKSDLMYLPKYTKMKLPFLERNKKAQSVMRTRIDHDLFEKMVS